MGTAIIITGLVFGCIFGGCSYIGDQPQVKPYVEKVLKFERDYIDPYRTPEDEFYGGNGDN